MLGRHAQQFDAFLTRRRRDGQQQVRVFHGLQLAHVPVIDLFAGQVGFSVLVRNQVVQGDAVDASMVVDNAGDRIVVAFEQAAYMEYVGLQVADKVLIQGLRHVMPPAISFADVEQVAHGVEHADVGRVEDVGEILAYQFN